MLHKDEALWLKMWLTCSLVNFYAVLRNVNLTLQHGTVTAIVGRSGAGKSTIAALLSRFYEPQSGGILLNGHSASEYSRGEWAKAVAMVSQEPVLFSGSIADNIAYGKCGHCTREDIIKAAEAANAHEFICRLPEGYDSMVGERGALLSGGLGWIWGVYPEP
jgi:ATP-binding cassette subfamily B (MDR/TAP) protein 8